MQWMEISDRCAPRLAGNGPSIAGRGRVGPFAGAPSNGDSSTLREGKRRDTDMQDLFTQSEDEFRVAHISRVEEKNRRLQTLLGELLQKNHELRLEVAHLHRED
jgi:hypothetical protein